jgi:hypothetical protein
MDASAASSGRPAAPQPEFGTGRLFLADSRLALGVLNQLRYQTMERWFGVSREHANLVTFVVVVGAADAAYETTRRIMRAPPLPSAADTAIGAVALRDAVLGIAGPADRHGPLVTLLTVGVLGGLAAPAVRRASVSLRAAERRLRERRIGRYRAAAGR